jgi:hypothetical protein
MRRTLSIITVVALFVMDGLGSYSVADPAIGAVPASEENVIPERWLGKEISVEQAEADNMVQGVPFGAMNKEWMQLKRSFQPGDSLWTYCSSPASFKALAGRCGMALVRNGKIINQMTTIEN